MDFATPDDAIFEAWPEADSGDTHVDRIQPSLLAQGPWDPEQQHGGAACALLARAIERCDTLVPMRVARITFDLTRGVPLSELRTTARVTRRGKKVQLVDASIVDGEVEVARARALMFRTRPDVGVPDEARGTAGLPRIGGPEDATPRFDPELLEMLPGYIRSLEFLRVGGEVRAGERSVAWMALRCPVVRGEVTSPLVRLGALCDFTSGIGNPIDHRKFTSINADVTVHLLRDPVAEGRWIGVSAESALGGDGTGQSFAELHDEQGLVARSQASLIVDSR